MNVEMASSGNTSTTRPKTVADLLNEIVVDGNSERNDCKMETSVEEEEETIMMETVKQEENEIAAAVELKLEDEEAMTVTGSVLSQPTKQMDPNRMPHLNKRLKVRWKDPSTTSARQRKQVAVGGSNVDPMTDVGGVDIGPEAFRAQFPLSDMQRVEEDNIRGEEGSDEEGPYSDNDATPDLDARAPGPIRVIIGRSKSTGQFSSSATAVGSSSRTSVSRRKRPREDMTWLLKGSSPGGPEIPDLIPSFGGHIACAIYSDPQKDRGVMSGQTRINGLKEMLTWNLLPAARDSVRQSGLGHLVSCMVDQLDMPLLTAFIERWQPDTNTFHLPVGEMSIFLHDVAEILKVPIGSQICTVSDNKIRSPVLSACEFLSCSAANLKKPYKVGKKAPILLSGGLLVDAIHERVISSRNAELQAQGYLMVLLGSTLFVDKTGDRVMSNLFPMVRDLDTVADFAWGPAVLAYLYRSLGKASRADCRTMAGCLTLLQIWIYEHFPCFRPRGHMDVPVRSEGARSRCWVTPKEKPRVEVLQQHRRTLDNLTPEMVTWLPYCNAPHITHPLTLFSGHIRFLDVVEPYRPVRCLRQFGYCQIIPPAIDVADLTHRPVDPKSYMLTWSRGVDANWKLVDDHLLVLDRKSVRAIPSYAVVEGYFPWYNIRTHLRVLNPSFQPIDIQRDIGMTDREFREKIVSIIGNFYSLSVEEQQTMAHQVLLEAEPVFRPFVHRDSRVGTRGDDY